MVLCFEIVSDYLFSRAGSKLAQRPRKSSAVVLCRFFVKPVPAFSLMWMCACLDSWGGDAQSQWAGVWAMRPGYLGNIGSSAGQRCCVPAQSVVDRKHKHLRAQESVFVSKSAHCRPIGSAQMLKDRRTTYQYSDAADVANNMG
jgi:hypothetical protein